MINMKGITEDFLLFIVGIFVILIILSTVFGKGIAYNLLGTLAEVEPTYLQENLRTILTVAAFSPGVYEARVSVNLKHTISLYDVPYPTVYVEAPAQFKFSNTTSQPFLSDDCEIVKTCTKNCSLIGDPCSALTDCCGILSCDTGHCASTMGDCGNGNLDNGEECDPGNQTLHITPNDTNCPEQCQTDCTCPKNYNQCNDGIDNDGDGYCDTPTSICKDGSIPGDSDCTNDHLKESLIEGEPCRLDSDCYKAINYQHTYSFSFYKCMSTVKFDKVGGVLIIKKYFEDNKCKIKIEKG